MNEIASIPYTEIERLSLDGSMVDIHNTAMCVLWRRGAASSKRNASTNLMEYRIPTD